MNPALKVSVSTQNSRDKETMFPDRSGNRLRQRTAVADAGGATVTDGVKTQLLEIRRQSRLVQILADHLGPGRKTRFDGRLDLQPSFHRSLGQQPGPDHHRRVGGVGAAGDRRNHDRTMSHLSGTGRKLHRNRLKQLCGVGIRTPLPHPAFNPLRSQIVALPFQSAHQRFSERLLGLGQSNPVLGPLGTGETRLHGIQIQLQDLGKLRDRGLFRSEQPLHFGVVFHQFHQFLFASRQLQIIQCLLVHRKIGGCGSILRTHVGDGSPVWKRQGGEPRSEEFNEFSDNPFVAQNLGDGEHQVGRRRPFP